MTRSGNSQHAPGGPGSSTHRPAVLLAICYIGFVSLGLPDTPIGVAWPSIRKTFGLQHSDISWLFFGAGTTYIVSSFFAGRLLKSMHVGTLLAGSSALVALANFDYSLARAWSFFALGGMLHGLGSGAIDAALNHYVASHFSARHMNWLHACYSLGAMLGPLVMTAMLAWTGSWRSGYLVVAITLLVLSLLFTATRNQWNNPIRTPSHPSPAAQSPRHVTAAFALQNRTVWLHIVVFFVYTGLEIAIGQWSFTVLTESRHTAVELAGIWVSIYWASIFVGRILFGFMVHRLGIDTLLRSSTVAALADTALFAWNPLPYAAPFALMLAGLALAPIYPCLMTRTPQRVGSAIAAHAIGFQVAAATLGGAALPSLTGLLAQYAGLSIVPATLFVIAVALLLLHETVVWTAPHIDPQP